MIYKRRRGGCHSPCIDLLLLDGATTFLCALPMSAYLSSMQRGTRRSFISKKANYYNRQVKRWHPAVRCLRKYKTLFFYFILFAQSETEYKQYHAANVYLGSECLLACCICRRSVFKKEVFCVSSRLWSVYIRHGTINDEFVLEVISLSFIIYEFDWFLNIQDLKDAAAMSWQVLL